LRRTGQADPAISTPGRCRGVRYFRDHRNLGPRERGAGRNGLHRVAQKTLFEALARNGSGPKERRLAILGFHGPRDFLKAALSPQEIKRVDECDAVKPAELMPQHRHNLPQWMADALQAQVATSSRHWPPACWSLLRWTCGSTP
jgi:hypothetical protein